MLRPQRDSCTTTPRLTTTALRLMPIQLRLITMCQDTVTTSLRLPTTVHDYATNYHDITCRSHKKDCILSRTANSDLYSWTNMTSSSRNIPGSNQINFLNAGTSSSLNSLMSCSSRPYTILGATALSKFFSFIFGQALQWQDHVLQHRSLDLPCVED